MASVRLLLSRCPKSRLISSITNDSNELKCLTLAQLKRNNFSSSSRTTPRRSNLFIWGLSAVAGIAAGGYYSYLQLLEQRPISNSSQNFVPKIITQLPNIQISRRVRNPNDTTELGIILFQYPTCPFCCKVRAFFDFHGLSYDIIEVNPVLRQQIKWSDYKKVPIVLVRVDGGYQQLNDSTMIISALSSYLRDRSTSLTEIVNYYPSIQFHGESGGRKNEIMNKYFLMYQNNIAEISNEQIINERKWRKWADEDLVHMLSPNVYRTKDEAFQAFNWFSEVGEWKRIFSAWEVSLIVNVGAIAMWLIGKNLKKRHGLKDDVRQSLYESCNIWLKELKKHGNFHGGASPNLADLAVYGVLNSIEGCDAFKDLIQNTKISKWYFDMKKVCNENRGTLILE